jgi:hypothetical protein
MTAPMFDPANSGRKYVAAPTALGKDLSQFDASQAAEHTTMDQMAGDTGGRAYYGTNGLAEAVSSAIDSGSNYYTLSYSPSDRDQHGEYRAIHVSLTRAAARGSQLSYRRGYYAEEPRIYVEPARGRAETSVADPAASAVDPRTAASAAYDREAMSHGSPAPEDILFQVSVHPVSTAPESELVGGNQANPKAEMKGPYRRYAIDFAALPEAFTFASETDGRRTASIVFEAYVFAPDGTLLSGIAKSMSLDLSAAKYQRVMEAGLGMRLEVSRFFAWRFRMFHRTSSV